MERGILAYIANGVILPREMRIGLGGDAQELRGVAHLVSGEMCGVDVR
jgi:hypothetical protein